MDNKKVGIALSGGGFRATLFHLGSIYRLNELGWLTTINEITSVSGGSIAAAYLGYKWSNLNFVNGVASNLATEVINPLRIFCSKTIDIWSILKGWLDPFHAPSSYVAANYRTLFGNATLQDLPNDNEGPRFTIYATSLQTGVSVRFSRPYIGEYRLGLYRNPDTKLATAVAASSGFPPLFCPVVIKLDPSKWDEKTKGDLFQNQELRETMLLGDGGIYDNLGIERLDGYETVLVSNAGAPFDVQVDSFLVRMSMLARTKRVLDITVNQTRALRERWLINEFKNSTRKGTYWGIATHIGNYKLVESGYPGPLINDSEDTSALSQIRTRLNEFTEKEQNSLMNWGYALTDAAMRRHVLSKDNQPIGTLPY